MTTEQDPSSNGNIQGPLQPTTTTTTGHSGSSNATNNTNQHSVVRYYDAVAGILMPIGGIRPITPTYMENASQMPIRVRTAQKLLVILDLNGTLFYSDEPNHKKRTFIKRPYLADLLRFLYLHCRVMIWSSAAPGRIGATLRAGFTGVQRLDRVWTRDDFRLHGMDYPRKVLTLKDLEFVWEAFENERSRADPKELAAGGRYEFRYDQSNTVLIDDSPHKSQLQPHNCLIIPDFDKERMESGTDQELLKVIRYLKDLMEYDNVSAFMRIRPFDTNSEYYLSKEFRRDFKLLLMTEEERADDKAMLTPKNSKEKHMELRKRRKEARKLVDAQLAQLAQAAQAGQMAQAAQVAAAQQTASQPGIADWANPTWIQQGFLPSPTNSVAIPSTILSTGPMAGSSAVAGFGAGPISSTGTGPDADSQLADRTARRKLKKQKKKQLMALLK
ncbi:hypothetical protein BGX29_009920 [Mortierella sp. GBA35]|nr:hypothetical protein BGX29_009920 [Mortierella sp. GBA35]